MGEYVGRAVHGLAGCERGSPVGGGTGRGRLQFLRARLYSLVAKGLNNHALPLSILEGLACDSVLSFSFFVKNRGKCEHIFLSLHREHCRYSAGGKS